MKKRFMGVFIVALAALLAACATPPAQAPAPAPQPAPALVQKTEPAPTPAPKSEPTFGIAVKRDIMLDDAENYTVAQGDSLSRIAAAKYGESNMFYFPLIYLANTGSVEDIDFIRPGTELVIPNLQSNLGNDGAALTLKDGILEAASLYEGRGKTQSASRLSGIAEGLSR